MHLQNLKAPWVDECYSYYGVWHDNFREFYDSMLTGINFSPPLYFFINFCIQLVFQTSIDQLRIQSLIFILIGIVLSFLLTRKIFGTVVAFFATILVTSQSNLLLSQAQEARHYAMFFACGAWVLYMQSLNYVATEKYKWLTFLSHLCLCQVHYLGIIFSLLSGLAYLLTSEDKESWKRIYVPITLCWLVSVVSYLFYLSRQKSVLNTWPKPNELSHLLSSYNDSILFITLLFPLFMFIITNKSKRDTKTYSIEETKYSRLIIITSALWFALPIIFWLLSHLSFLNLFVDRYFIPKESALIFLVAKGFNLIFQKLPNNSDHIQLLGTLTLSFILILMSTKRSAFGLNMDTNYHHSLIIKNSISKSERPIIIKDDPNFFPNAYLRHHKVVFQVENLETENLYKQFSKRIKICRIK